MTPEEEAKMKEYEKQITEAGHKAVNDVINNAAAGLQRREMPENTGRLQEESCRENGASYEAVVVEKAGRFPGRLK